MGKRIRLLNLALSLSGVSIEMYYTFCGEVCQYLKGSLLGVSLEYVGIAFMGAVTVFSLLDRASLLKALLSAGLGGELFLLGFQFYHSIFCPYCLAFGVVLFCLFILNVRRRDAVMAVPFAVLSFVLFLLFFQASFIPYFGWVEGEEGRKCLPYPAGLSRNRTSCSWLHLQAAQLLGPQARGSLQTMSHLQDTSGRLSEIQS